MGTLAHGARVAIALALVALVAALGAAIALWSGRHALAEHVLRAAAHARGLEAPLALTVERVDGAGAALRDVAVGAPDAPDLRVARIEADWSLAGLRAGRLDALRARGIHLRATLDARGLSLGALDSLLAGDAPPAGAPAPLPVLPADAVALDDVHVALSTPEGVVDATLAGALDAAPDGAVAGRADLAIEHPLGEAQGAIELTGRLDALAFDAALDGRLADARQRLAVRARGAADARSGALRAEWTLAPLVFGPGTLQPEALYPPFSRFALREVAGRVEARGDATRAPDGTLAWRAEVALHGLAASAPLARVEGVHGVLALAGPPAHTPARQLVAIGLLDVGVPLRDGLVEATLRRDGALAVRRAHFAFAGGALEARDALVDPRAGPGAVTLRAAGLDLAQLLAHVRLEGLSGTGQLDGELPLAPGDGGLHVTGGVLRATPAGGTIRYAPAGSLRQLAASRPHDLGLALEAFSDFHYEALEARLDGALDGELTIGLSVRGANPAFQDGRAVELNLDLEAHLADLVRAGRASYRVPAVVEERLRAFSEGASQ